MPSEFGRSRFDIKEVSTGRRKGEFMVRFKPKGKPISTLSIVPTRAKARALVKRMKKL